MSMSLTKEVIKSISQKLSLPFTGIEQDWEVELADSARVEEFIIFYKNEKLISAEKKVLMSLIFASYDDLLTEREIDSDALWAEITSLINEDRSLFTELLDYWRLEGEEVPENYFKITPLIREIS